MEVRTVYGKELTTIRLGGECKVYFPENSQELSSVLQNDERFFIIGGGSNLVISDNPSFSFVSLKKFEKIRFGEKKVFLGAGVPLKKLVPMQIKRSFSLFEFLAGVPQITVGGAVAQNAGAFGKEIKNILEKVTFFSFEDFSLKEFTDFSQFSYRKTPFPNNGVILEAVFKVEKDENIKEKISKFVNERLLKHPSFTLWTAGSTFKNTESFPAGYLIDKVGLKGFSVGGIKVSEKHGNFLINTGDGTFSDFCKIIDIIRCKVFRNFGIELELEVKVPGTQI